MMQRDAANVMRDAPPADPVEYRRERRLQWADTMVLAMIPEDAAHAMVRDRREYGDFAGALDLVAAGYARLMGTGAARRFTEAVNVALLRDVRYPPPFWSGWAN